MPIGHYVFICLAKMENAILIIIVALKQVKEDIKEQKKQRIENGSSYYIPDTDVSVSRFSGIDKKVIKNIPVAIVP